MCFKEGTVDLFSLNVVSTVFHALLPVGVLESSICKGTNGI